MQRDEGVLNNNKKDISTNEDNKKVNNSNEDTNQNLQHKKISTQTLVKVGVLSAIGYVLMFISVPLPFLFPDFLKIDISDLPVLVGGITLGPLMGVLVAFIKNLLQFLTGMSTTGGIGELANFLIGTSLVFVSSNLFKEKSKKNLIKALAFGVISMSIMGCLSNYFLILPFYSTIMPIEAVIEMASAINPIISSKIDFIIWMIIPFNLVKGFIISSVTVLVYDKIKKIL